MTIAHHLYIDWDRDGTYTNETSRLVEANGRMTLAAPEESITSPKGMVSQMTLKLDNGDNRFSALDSGGALYSVISGGGYYQCPMYFEVSDDGGANYHRLFTGVIKGPVEESRTYRSPATVSFDCRSREELILNKRISTSLNTFKTLHDSGATESQIIAQWLGDAGLTSGDYTLDPGLFQIEWAWLDDESPIEDCWQLASACGGYFYCDPDGEFRYENMAHWLGSPHNTSQETLGKADYGSLRLKYDDSELYQNIIISVGSRRVVETAVIWEANQVYAIPPGTTRVVVAQYQQPAYIIDAVTHAAQSAGGINMAANISIARTDYAQRASMLITNNHATLTALVRNLQIYGRAVHGGPAEELSLGSGADFWTGVSFAPDRPRQGRTRRIRGNQYVQTKAQGDALIRFLRDRHQLPRTFVSVGGTLGKPERRLGDRVTIEDPDTLSADIDIFLLSISWRYGNTGFTQDLEGLDATGLFADSNPVYFVIGASGNDLGQADPQRGKVYY